MSVTHQVYEKVKCYDLHRRASYSAKYEHLS